MTYHLSVYATTHLDPKNGTRQETTVPDNVAAHTMFYAWCQQLRDYGYHDVYQHVSYEDAYAVMRSDIATASVLMYSHDVISDKKG